MISGKAQFYNPEHEILGIDDPVFAEYGRRISNGDVSEIINIAKKVTELPKEGSIYEPSKVAFEELDIFRWIQRECFGELPIQLGYCYGHNQLLNALEWHTSSEINIAVTDLVMFLAKRSDYQNGKIDSAKVKAFLLKEGDVVEVYATTLHYCPCEVTKEGFGCVVALPKGTNTPLDERPHNPLLFCKNKWLVAHEDNDELIKQDVAIGITGKNHKINLVR